MYSHHSPDLKPRSARLRHGQMARLLLWSFCWLLAQCAVASATLRIDVEPEEPSGVFWATDTLRTQTELLFSLRVRNDLDSARPVHLYWRVIDGEGKTRLSDNAKFDLEARGSAVRRVLFEAPARGAYLMVVEGKGRRDDNVVIETPFVVVVTPSESYRPRSFFGITAPTLLEANDLMFYKRIGARVLRSEWMPAAGVLAPGVAAATTPLTTAMLDTQLQARLNHSLATQGVLPYQPGFGEDVWVRQAREMAQRYRGIEQWEVDDRLPDATLQNFAAQFKSARPDTQLFALMPQGPISAQPINGWTVSLPASARPGGVDQSSAAIMRLLLAQTERANATNAALRVRQEFGGDPDAVAAASEMVTRYIMAISAGASGFNASIPTAHTQGLWSRQRLTAMSKAAAFTHMAARLEDTSFSRDVWSHLPSLWATVFKTPTQALAVVWADSGSQSGRLNVAWPATPDGTEARIYDLFGNPIGESRGGRLTIPLGPTPVYVVGNIGPNELAEAIGKGEMSGLPQLVAWAQPVTRVPVGENPAPLRVVLQNIGIEPADGTVQVSTPRGWKLGEFRRQFNLKPGEYATYEFPVEQARIEADGMYPLRINASTQRGNWQWRQRLHTATAINVREGEEMRIDGVLDEWDNAAWMRVAADSRDASLQDAQVALKWSADNLYIAAQVRENRLTPRDDAASEYSFWRDSDAIQLAFGLRDEPWMRPAWGRFRDTDYGFLLSPFRTLNDGTVEARILRLWHPRIPFGELPDRVRYGGIVPGARCVITRNQTTGITSYEAVLPLQEMPQLQSSGRAAGTVNERPVRFGWIAHDESGLSLQWNRATETFPWWNNTGSFLPADALHFAAQAELGFTQIGALSAAPPAYVPPPSSSANASVAAPIQPVTPSIVRPRPTPTPRSAPPDYTSPMPIDLLPPAAPVEGEILPPSHTP